MTIKRPSIRILQVVPVILITPYYYSPLNGCFCLIMCDADGCIGKIGGPQELATSLIRAYDMVRCKNPVFPPV